ncbi:unnamed protein product, partial [Larinioides sclopetarius]
AQTRYSSLFTLGSPRKHAGRARGNSNDTVANMWRVERRNYKIHQERL